MAGTTTLKSLLCSGRQDLCFRGLYRHYHCGRHNKFTASSSSVSFSTSSSAFTSSSFSSSPSVCCKKVTATIVPLGWWWSTTTSPRRYFTAKTNGVDFEALAKLNYFHLLMQPENFDLDPKILSKAFLQRQREFHPDKFVLGTAQDRAQASQLSSACNTAYQTLNDSHSRAIYLLKVKWGIAEDDLATVDLGEHFLEEMMHVMGVLSCVQIPVTDGGGGGENAKSDHSSTSSSSSSSSSEGSSSTSTSSSSSTEALLATLNATYTSKYEETVRQLQVAFDVTGDREQAKLLVSKLKFYKNIREVIKEKELGETGWVSTHKHSQRKKTNLRVFLVSYSLMDDP